MVLAGVWLATGRSPARAARAPAPLTGSIDSIGQGGLLITGWVAAGTETAPRVVIVADGTEIARLRPTTLRFDVAASLGTNWESWGFRVRLERTAKRHVCLSAVINGKRKGLDCVFLNADEFAPALGGGPVRGESGRVVRYSVEVEGRSGLHPESVARAVDRVLADARSWSGDPRWRFRRALPEVAHVRILVASPATVDRLCYPFRTGGRLSCRRGSRVILNVDRWNGAVTHWTASLFQYRAYLVNHELGHYLGFGHATCPGPGRRAPVMMQQTKYLLGCRPNGWVYP